MAENKIKDEILLAMLAHVPFDGWTQKALRRGAVDAGHVAAMARRVFPGGMMELTEHFSAYADRLMLDQLEKQNLQEMRVHERITLAVRCRFEVLQPYREALRRVTAYLALPMNVLLATRLTYQTVNAIWYVAGDTAADFNFYTKRALLGAVYASTGVYWLNDTSKDNAATWSFLDRRIGNVMKIPGYTKRAKDLIARLPKPWNIARGLRNPLRKFSSER